MIRLAIAGASGRTGSCVLKLALADVRFCVVAALCEPNSSWIGKPASNSSNDLRFSDKLNIPCDVVIDFTTPAGTMTILEFCRSNGLALVSGVTGLDEDQMARLKESARHIPVLHASNFSWGIGVISAQISQMAQALGDGYDVEIVETHHRHKVDAPSGTALMLLESLKKVLSGSSQVTTALGRSGTTGPKPKGEIGIHSVRMGDRVGSHEIHFSGPGETVTIRHEAQSRDTFASGALRAAIWLADRKASHLYGMNDLTSYFLKSRPQIPV